MFIPQQNGTAEHMNRSILKKARYMMCESGCPKKLRGEAVFTAIYFLHRSPTYRLDNVTPVEIWYQNEKLDVNNLRIFKYIAYVKMSSENLSKLDEKNEKCILVGFRNNGYT